MHMRRLAAITAPEEEPIAISTEAAAAYEHDIGHFARRMQVCGRTSCRFACRSPGHCSYASIGGLASGAFAPIRNPERPGPRRCPASVARRRVKSPCCCAARAWPAAGAGTTRAEPNLPSILQQEVPDLRSECVRAALGQHHGGLGGRHGAPDRPGPGLPAADRLGAHGRGGQGVTRGSFENRRVGPHPAPSPRSSPGALPMNAATVRQKA